MTRTKQTAHKTQSTREEIERAYNEAKMKGVSRRPGGKFQAQAKKDGKMRYLGIFATAEEASLAYVRHIGKKTATKAALAAAARITARIIAKEAALREGLELVPADTKSGFKNVHLVRNGSFQAQAKKDGKMRYCLLYTSPSPRD